MVVRRFACKHVLVEIGWHGRIRLKYIQIGMLFILFNTSHFVRDAPWLTAVHSFGPRILRKKKYKKQSIRHHFRISDGKCARVLRSKSTAATINWLSWKQKTKNKKNRTILIINNQFQYTSYRGRCGFLHAMVAHRTKPLRSWHVLHQRETLIYANIDWLYFFFFASAICFLYRATEPIVEIIVFTC